MAESRNQAATVVAIFTGATREVLIRDRPEPTAFQRLRRNGRVMVGQSGLEGDTLGTPRRLGRANHALYLLAQAHYAAHADRLGRPVPVGGFSENILYAGGPDEAAVRIGDRMHLGSAVITVTLPRVPCYKLAHFLNTDQGFPAGFSASTKTGFYARVDDPGEVWDGAALTVADSDPRNATLADLNHALTDPTPDLGRIKAVLASPALLPELATMVRERFALLRPELAAGASAATITAHCRIAPDIARIEVSPPPGDPAWRWPWVAGQFVTLGPQGGADLRCYSLVDGPTTAAPARPFAVAVRRGVAGAAPSVSRWLETEATPGSAVALYPPAGRFVLPEAPGSVLLIGGGIGMTPILSLWRALAARGQTAPARLVQVARTAADLIFADEIAAALSRMPQGAVQRHVTGACQTGPGYAALPPAQAGRPDLPAIIAAMPEGADVYVCGPQPMIAAAEAAHRALGGAPARFHSEAFEATSEAATGDIADLPPAGVHVSGAGMLGQWTAADGPLLGWIEARLNRRLPASCRSGLCRTCAGRLLRGRVRYPTGIVAPAGDDVLLCCARPDGDIEVALP